MNRSWVRFPQAAQKRPPLQGWTLSSMYEARAECAGERVGYRVRVSRAAGARGCGCPGLVPLSRPGCLVCPWAAARPLAVRAASFARCVVSKPGQAPPPPTGTAAWPSGPSALALVGFSIRSLLVACRRRVGPSRSEIPPFGGGEVAVRGGVVLKVQTTSAKNAENGLLRARWSAFWAQRRLVGCVVRARTRCCER